MSTPSIPAPKPPASATRNRTGAPHVVVDGAPPALGPASGNLAGRQVSPPVTSMSHNTTCGSSSSSSNSNHSALFSTTVSSGHRSTVTPAMDPASQQMATPFVTPAPGSLNNLPRSKVVSCNPQHSPLLSESVPQELPHPTTTQRYVITPDNTQRAFHTSPQATRNITPTAPHHAPTTPSPSYATGIPVAIDVGYPAPRNNVPTAPRHAPYTPAPASVESNQPRPTVQVHTRSRWGTRTVHHIPSHPLPISESGPGSEPRRVSQIAWSTFIVTLSIFATLALFFLFLV